MRHLRRDDDGIQDASGKVPEGEPVFLLRAKDPIASSMVAQWAYAQMTAGADDDLVARVFDWSAEMARYHREHYAPRDHADVPEGMLREADHA